MVRRMVRRPGVVVQVGLAGVLGCATVPPPPPACPEPDPAFEAELAAGAATPAPPPELTQDDVIARSRAFLEAHDQRDVARFQGLAGPAFVLFEEGRSYDAAFLVQSMQAAKARPARARTCADESVSRQPGLAVYQGMCKEQVPAFGDRPATSYEGWNTVVWSPVDGAWRVGYWGWQKGGLELERDRWNEAFRKQVNFKQTPNQHLVEAVKGRRPGTALDIAMGQGRNAIHLASRGWKVTGVDISDEGIRLATETAAKQKLKLTTVLHDIDTYDLGRGRWDLVTLIYAGDDPKLIERIQASVKRGGLVVIEYFHDDATQGTGMGGFATGELTRLFEGWKIVQDDAVEAVADWGLRRTKIVRFVAQKR